MADSSDEDTDSEIIDLSPLWRDYPFLTDYKREQRKKDKQRFAEQAEDCGPPIVLQLTPISEIAKKTDVETNKNVIRENEKNLNIRRAFENDHFPRATWNVPTSSRRPLGPLSSLDEGAHCSYHSSSSKSRLKEDDRFPRSSKSKPARRASGPLSTIDENPHCSYSSTTKSRMEDGDRFPRTTRASPTSSRRPVGSASTINENPHCSYRSNKTSPRFEDNRFSRPKRHALEHSSNRTLGFLSTIDENPHCSHHIIMNSRFDDFPRAMRHGTKPSARRPLSSLTTIDESPLSSHHSSTTNSRLDLLRNTGPDDGNRLLRSRGYVNLLDVDNNINYTTSLNISESTTSSIEDEAETIHFSLN